MDEVALPTASTRCQLSFETGLRILLAASQQHTTLHTTAGLLLTLSRVGPGQFLVGRPDAAGSGVGGPVGGTLSSGLKKKISQRPRAAPALCRVPFFGWDVKRVSWLSEVIKDPMALIVRVGVSTPVSWPSNHHGHLIIPSLQLAHSSPLRSSVTIPQVVASNENVFSVNLPGKITDK